MERIPVLRMGSLLLITIQVDMHDKLAMQLQDDVTQRISEWGSTGVLIDISSLEIVDSFIGRMLGSIASMARLLDADTVVVGMQPSVAITLVELGLSLTGIRTALDVEKGMAALQNAVSLETEDGDERPQLEAELTAHEAAMKPAQRQTFHPRRDRWIHGRGPRLLTIRRKCQRHNQEADILTASLR